MAFIVIEGDNGTGKDTQALKLEEAFKFDVITNYDNMKQLNREAKTYEGKERVKKFLEYCALCSNYATEGDNSIVVRYWVSTLAAAYADNIFTYEETIKLQEEFCSKMKKPDIVICLWCDFNNRIQRINDRNSDDFDDITENRSMKYAWFLNKMKEKYDLNWVDINTTGKTIDEVYKEIANHVSDLDSKKQEIKKKVNTIVFAGGPCSGKSESIEILRQYLMDLNFKVVVIPELATEIRRDGLIHTDGIISKNDFQRVIFDLQLYKEELYKTILQKYEGKEDVILLLDRGLLDAKIYLSKDDFDKLLEEHNLKEKDIIDRYDVVFHLESAANMGDEYYNNIGNQFRLSNSEQAKIQELKSIEVWSKHPNFHMINIEKTFDDKVEKIKKDVLKEIKK